MQLVRANLRLKAIQLRQKGYSYELIRQRLGISKSTLSDWLKEIPYIPNKVTLERMSRGRKKAKNTIKLQKIKRTNEAIKIAKSELKSLSQRDLMMIGIGLYIGEGGKYNNGFIQFSNSDPKVIKLMMTWFSKILKIKKCNFYLIIHMYPDNDLNEVTSFWSKLTKIPTNQFGKTYIDRRIKKTRKYVRKLKYGTLHIRVRGLEKYAKVALFNKVLTWIEVVKNSNFAGIV